MLTFDHAVIWRFHCTKKRVRRQILLFSLLFFAVQILPLMSRGAQKKGGADINFCS